MPLCVFPDFISQYQYESTKWNYSTYWYLFFSHLSTVLIPPVLSGLLSILPLLSWPNFQLPFCCLLFHLPNPLALCTSLITLLELFMSVFYFWETVCLMTWLLCHSFSFAQWPSPVLATHVEWMTKPVLLLMLSQFVVAYFNFLKLTIFFFWLCWVFIAAGLLTDFGVQVSHCSSFSCCIAWALGHRLNSCGSQA